RIPGRTHTTARAPHRPAALAARPARDRGRRRRRTGNGPAPDARGHRQARRNPPPTRFGKSHRFRRRAGTQPPGTGRRITAPACAPRRNCYGIGGTFRGGNSCLRRFRMKKEMLINVLQPEECRIAILEDGVLEELYVERTSHESYVGNIYKGRI